MTNENPINIGSLSQIPPGEGRIFQINGHKIAVFHDRSGSVFASEPVCPHADGPLADGLLGGGKVVCPLHERIFDLSSGYSTNSDCSIKIFSISRTEGEELLLHL